MKKFSKVFIKVLSSLSCFLFVIFLASFYVKIENANSYKKPIVVIDAGHGGIDAGASGVNTGVRESDLNLLIAKKLKNNFLNAGFEVFMTREDNSGLYGTTDPGFKLRDLNKRVGIINSKNAKICISIHLNTYKSSSRRGAQTFYKKGDKNGEKLAKFIQNRINGLKLVPRLYNHLYGDYYLLNQCKPTTVIVECGFLSSPDDERLLLTEEYRNDIALAIFNGSLDFFCA